MPKGKSKKERPSAQEIALAESSGYKAQRHAQAFEPLENEAIAELDSADLPARSAMLSSRANSDLEQQVAGMKNDGMVADIRSNTFGGGATSMRGFRHAGAATQGKDMLRARADQDARKSLDADTLNVIKTGQGIARQAQSGLTQSAKLQNSANASKVAAQNLKDQARNQAITQVAMAAGFSGFDAYKRGTGVGANGSYTVPDENLNWASRGMRKMFGSNDAISDVDRMRTSRLTSQPEYVA